jgi:hypothetical protein
MPRAPTAATNPNQLFRTTNPNLCRRLRQRLSERLQKVDALGEESVRLL